MNSSLELRNIKEALKEAKRDETVGIRITKLTGNDTVAIYAAEIDGYKRVGAHYHTEGIELYQVVEGTGSIYIGLPKSDGEVDWKEPVAVVAGDCFTVNAGEVHQLVNSSSKQLIIVFVCPYSHISTDRTVVDGFSE